MEVWVKTVEIFGNVVFLGGLGVLAYGLIMLFTSLNGQNPEGKNHAALGLAAGAGLIACSQTLIPMLATAISF